VVLYTPPNKRYLLGRGDDYWLMLKQKYNDEMWIMAPSNKFRGGEPYLRS
jgi:hypothetical protein